MRKDTPITLLEVERSSNANGFPVENIKSQNKVLAERKSIQRVEFYQAASSGLKPEKTFVVWASEYNDENELDHKGKRYRIIRTYSKDLKNVELTCSGDI